MSDHLGAPLGRVIPIIPAEDRPCPLALRERTREQLYPLYRGFAEVTRQHKRALVRYAAQRQQAKGVLPWLQAGLGQLENWVEYRFARSHLANVAQGLDHDRVNAALGWPMGYAPSCQPQVRPSALRRTFAVLTAAALVITPARADQLPLTADQKMEWENYRALCISGNGKRPDMPMPPCHAPKIGLRNDDTVKMRKTLA
jgi:hypothetical protein